MPNGSAGWISLELGARAGAHAPVSACASGAEAIGYGIDMIRSGRADVVIAGGTEAAIHAAEPRRVRRDARAVHAQRRARARLAAVRQGPGRLRARRGRGRRGAGVGRARGARGARGYAAAAGVGYSADAHHIAQPDPDGHGRQSRAIQRRARRRRPGSGQVVHVNAHATSTPAGDVGEAQGHRGARSADGGRVVVAATKSMTGHLLGGAGALEAVATILALRDGGRPADHQPRRPRRRRRRRHRRRATAAAADTAASRGRAEQLVRLRRPQRLRSPSPPPRRPARTPLTLLTAGVP